MTLKKKMTDFPSVRACLFDMDGLLLDTEDLYTDAINTVLRRYNRPDLPWSIKAQFQARPGPEADAVFFPWAQLPISPEQWQAEYGVAQAEFFPRAKPLIGVETLIADLVATHAFPDVDKITATATPPEHHVHIALATSSRKNTFEIKSRSTARNRALFDLFPANQVILGDDHRVTGKGKPRPDIYLLALQSINDVLPPNVRPIEPAECLVFEDAVLGVQAARRAGMRVVWVPHPGLAEVMKGREPEVLAGKPGLLGGKVESDVAERTGEIDDGWAEQLHNLEEFPYGMYGIVIPPPNAKEEDEILDGVHV